MTTEVNTIVDAQATKKGSTVVLKPTIRRPSVNPQAVAKVIRPSLLETPSLHAEAEPEMPRRIKPAGIKPTGGGSLVKPENAPLAIGLTLEQVKALQEAGKPMLTPMTSGEEAEERGEKITVHGGLRQQENEEGSSKEWIDAQLEDEQASLAFNELDENAAIFADGVSDPLEPEKEFLYRPKRPAYQTDLEFAQDLSLADPKMVAWTVREWMTPK